MIPPSVAHARNFTEYIVSHGVELPVAELMSCASEFIAEKAVELTESLPQGALLGLSSTFTQTTASLALIRRVKNARPDILTIYGGANTNADRAEVLLSRMPELDCVVVGEGEKALVSLIRSVDEDAVFDESIPGLMSRRPLIASATPRQFIDLNGNAAPVMAAHFEQLHAQGLDNEIEPRLAYEIGRGCWWGEKHHCTFCGLNGEGMTYRRRDDDSAAMQLLALVRRHRVLDIILADNILHPIDIENVFAKFPTELDLRVHLEVKANLKRDEIKKLRNHGVWHMQPGIESLARRPLELMRKGVRPWQNIRFLRDAEELGVTVSWNILTGFPGELLEDYDEMLQQLDRLHHLQPPGSVAALGLVRYSPLFKDASLGVPFKRPTKDNFYTFAGWDLSEIEIMAEVYESPEPLGCSVELAPLLDPLITNWQSAHRNSFLVEVRETDGSVSIRWPGTGRPERRFQGWEAQVWERLRGGKSPAALRRVLDDATEQAGSHRLPSIFLEDLLADGLIYQDQGTLITLPARYEDHLPYRFGPS